MKNLKFNSFSTNNLKKIEQLVWDFFLQGVKNKKSAFHYPTIASCGSKTFSLRTVVLREVAREDRVITFHTDIRSNKVKELKYNNKLLLHVYDKKNQIQIQAEGKAKIFNKVKECQLKWHSFSNYTKISYLTKEIPGKKIKNEKDFQYLNDKEGYANFSIAKVKINKIIFLNLNLNGNKKALIRYKKNNIIYNWLVP